jgi:hypothetical protein
LTTLHEQDGDSQNCGCQAMVTIILGHFSHVMSLMAGSVFQSNWSSILHQTSLSDMPEMFPAWYEGPHLAPTGIRIALY